MTKLEAFIRIDRLFHDEPQRIMPDHAKDAKRLVKALPDCTLEVLHEEWIRPEPIQGDRVEFFWSRSGDMMDPGNRITQLQTLGSGRFAVLTGEPNLIQWQCLPDGRPMPDVLALDSDGAEALLVQLIEWQTFKGENPGD